MSAGRLLSVELRDEILEQASNQQLQLALTCKDANGWVNVKCRFLAHDAGARRLRIEYPGGHPSGPAPKIAAGQNVGVAFRRGHKKCVFATTAAGREPRDSDSAGRSSVLCLH